MRHCAGCSKSFPKLDVDECAKCLKQLLSPNDESIKDIPQCEVCGCVFQFLTGKACASCEEVHPMEFQTGHQVSDGTLPMREASILEQMETHSLQASEHQLNQWPKNAGLQKASQVNEVTAALKRQNCVETLNIFLSIFLCLPDKSKAAKKYHIPLIPVNVDMREIAEKVLVQMLTKASINAIFAVTQSAMECFHLEQSYTSSVTVGQMYSHIKTMGQLSEKDRKRNALSLHLLLNELTDHDEDGPDDEFIMKFAKKSRARTKAPASTRRPKQRLESVGPCPGM
ncbi:hypothetical protein SCLCIDRAFT_17007 [Scleroderma citrinum Foug A]|uniref:Uncharacterized protein n=1 Tax=Scleroderma citrinum Foug A TaxID=1036808 RepID=A0A0C2Z5L3_9AGAM|nr:hypothetical protein SCLCIDRAFT_17007 [Scleroderma citrinum Foug A]